MITLTFPMAIFETSPSNRMEESTVYTAHRTSGSYKTDNINRTSQNLQIVRQELLFQWDGGDYEARVQDLAIPLVDFVECFPPRFACGISHFWHEKSLFRVEQGN